MVHDSLSLCKRRGAPTVSPVFRFWKVVGVALLVEVVAILVFYGSDWLWLRRLHVTWLQSTFQGLGCEVQAAGTLLTVDGHRFQVDPDCTYVDLILCSLPLLWRVHRRPAANVVVMAAFATSVLVVNLVRVLFGVHGVTRGISLFWAHDFVDYLIWYPALGIVAFLWVGSLRTLWSSLENERVAAKHLGSVAGARVGDHHSDKLSLEGEASA